MDGSERKPNGNLEELVSNFETNANMGCTKKIELLRRPVEGRVAPPKTWNWARPKPKCPWTPLCARARSAKKRAVQRRVLCKEACKEACSAESALQRSVLCKEACCAEESALQRSVLCTAPSCQPARRVAAARRRQRQLWQCLAPSRLRTVMESTAPSRCTSPR